MAKCSPVDNCKPDAPMQFKVRESVKKNSRLKSKDVFDKPKGQEEKKKKKVPKGSHRMPDGTIMKDKDMPKAKSKSKY